MDITVSYEEDGILLRDFLSKNLGYSGGMIKKLKFRDMGICVNGEFKTVRYVLKEGDILSLKVEDTEEDTCPYMIPVDLPVKIAYEDSLVTVVDKPPLMPAHPSYLHRLDTVANALAFRYSDAPYVFRPVNRLDRETSGLMLTARSRFAASKLFEAMVSGNIKKYYIAVLEKTPEESMGVIKTYMKRVKDSIIERCVCSPGEEKAKIAVTAYKVIYEKDGICAVAAAPITGRTHQLRVHFSHIGCPICGDTMYGGGNDKTERTALHSSYLSFPHPNGGNIEIYSSLPSDINALLGDDGDRVFKAFREAVAGDLSEIRKKLEDNKKNEEIYS